MSGPPKWQRDQIPKGQNAAPLIYLPIRGLAAKDGSHLKVDDFRGREPLPAEPAPRSIPVMAIIGQGGDQDARVDNDHRPSRSKRTKALATSNETEPPARPPARSRTSSKVGPLASSTSRPRRYS